MIESNQQNEEIEKEYILTQMQNCQQLQYHLQLQQSQINQDRQKIEEILQTNQELKQKEKKYALQINMLTETQKKLNQNIEKLEKSKELMLKFNDTSILDLHSKLTYQQNQSDIQMKRLKKLKEIQAELQNKLNELQPQNLQNLENKIELLQQENKFYQIQVIKFQQQNQKIVKFVQELEKNLNLKRSDNEFLENFLKIYENLQNIINPLTFIPQNLKQLLILYIASDLTLMSLCEFDTNKLSQIYTIALLKQILIFQINEDNLKDSDIQMEILKEIKENKIEIEKIENLIEQKQIKTLIFSKNFYLLKTLILMSEIKKLNKFELNILNSQVNSDFYDQIFQDFIVKFKVQINKQFSPLSGIQKFETQINSLKNEKQEKIQKINQFASLKLQNEKINEIEKKIQILNQKYQIKNEIQNTNQEEQLALYEQELMNQKENKFLLNKMHFMKPHKTTVKKVLDLKYPPQIDQNDENRMLKIIQTYYI